MADKSETKYFGMTPKQAVMIGVLGTMLVGVILFGQGGETPVETDDVAATAESGQNNARRKTSTSDPVAHVAHWPKVSLDEIIKHNPFSGPAVTPDVATIETVTSPVEEEPPSATADETEREEIEQERQRKAATLLAEFQSQKVKMVLRTNNKVAAVIGDQLVHEGDVIDGIRIVSILSNGVVVEAIPPESAE